EDRRVDLPAHAADRDGVQVAGVVGVQLAVVVGVQPEAQADRGGDDADLGARVEQEIARDGIALVLHGGGQPGDVPPRGGVFAGDDLLLGVELDSVVHGNRHAVLGGGRDRRAE